MNHTRKHIAIGLAVATLAPGLGQAAIPHEPDRVSESGAAVAGGIADRPAPPDRVSGVSGTAVAGAVAGRPAPPLGRLDGSLPPPSVGTSGTFTSGAGVARTASVTPPRPIVIADESGGFDWADAGLGFAAATALVLLGTGSVATVRWRRHAGSPAM